MPTNIKSIYCGDPCGAICFPFTHVGDLTFRWTVGEQAYSYTGTASGEVCVPFLFPEQGETIVEVFDGENLITFEVYDGFRIVGIPESADPETKAELLALCVDTLFEVTFTGEGSLIPAI